MTNPTPPVRARCGEGRDIAQRKWVAGPHRRHPAASALYRCVREVAAWKAGLGSRARRAAGVRQMPGGAAVPRSAVVAPTPSRAGRRVLTGPSSAGRGKRLPGNSSARAVLVRWYRGKLVRQGDRLPGPASQGKADPQASSAPARRAASPSRPASSTALPQLPAVSPRWRWCGGRVETGPRSRRPLVQAASGARFRNLRSRRRRSRGPGPGWRRGARDRGRTPRTACRRPQYRRGGRRTSPTRRRS